MNTKKVAAYTLSELLVVMLITSIIIMLTFNILRLTQNQLTYLQKISNKNTEVQLLHRVLLKDFNTHKVYVTSKNNLLCTNSLDSISYQITPNYVIRMLDTFHIKIQEAHTYLNNRKVSVGSIDGIELRFDKSLSPKNIFLYKIKDAAHYMNQ